MNNSDKTLHIVAFDIPVPVNYGGAIDIYYKLKELHNSGINVILHCFQYGGRKPAPELKKICREVHYYPRKKMVHDILGSIPYIVNSRRDDKLLERLKNDKHPILFEGIHSCYYLSDPALKSRFKIVRTHNIEHNYYAGLGKSEKNPLRKLYFQREAQQLAAFEKKLKHASAIAVISKNDSMYFSEHFKNVFICSAFHPYNFVQVNPGKGGYALYHGSLEVNENHEAAMYLVTKIFQSLPYHLIIAGNKPKRELVSITEKLPNVEIRTGLTIEQIHELVANAQINILPTFQATGIKLKLLLALFRGRHCLVNTPMVVNTGLENLCHIADTDDDMKKNIHTLFEKNIQDTEISEREKILKENGFYNSTNAEILIRKIFG